MSSQELFGELISKHTNEEKIYRLSEWVFLYYEMNAETAKGYLAYVEKIKAAKRPMIIATQGFGCDYYVVEYRCEKELTDRQLDIIEELFSRLFDSFRYPGFCGDCRDWDTYDFDKNYGFICVRAHHPKYHLPSMLGLREVTDILVDVLHKNSDFDLLGYQPKIHRNWFSIK
ncbi:hypothetical protein [Fischerella sp. PCC 9605]|uniref:hypothetical protein n=1 Tax=Fischerella sp. PCC 9605 TaxID=1173024 RepID=UPI0004789E05|nr:hypothetical protein [Fischerella sp. PCC 9605]